MSYENSETELNLQFITKVKLLLGEFATELISFSIYKQKTNHSGRLCTYGRIFYVKYRKIDPNHVLKANYFGPLNCIIILGFASSTKDPSLNIPHSSSMSLSILSHFNLWFLHVPRRGLMCICFPIYASHWPLCKWCSMEKYNNFSTPLFN